MVDHQFHEVGQFHHKFGLDNTTYDSLPGPRDLPIDLIRFRMMFLCEELQEFMEGVGLTFRNSLWDMVMQGADWNCEKTPAKMFDSLIDLVYVAYGTAHLLGYPWEEGWTRVQHANMAKVRALADASDSTRGSAYDVVKPAGWVPPDIDALMKEYGW